jgi:hypothetical protein
LLLIIVCLASVLVLLLVRINLGPEVVVQLEVFPPQVALGCAV